MADDKEETPVSATSKADASSEGVTNPAFDADDTKENDSKERKTDAPNGAAAEKPKVITAAGAGQVESGYRRVEPSEPVEKKSKRVACAGLFCLVFLLLIVIIVLLAVFLSKDGSSGDEVTPTPSGAGGNSRVG